MLIGKEHISTLNRLGFIVDYPRADNSNLAEVNDAEPDDENGVEYEQTPSLDVNQFEFGVYIVQLILGQDLDP